MWDILVFDRFITPTVLIVAYYMGAILMPFALWLARHYLLRRIALLARLDLQRQALFASLSRRNRVLLTAALVLIFLFMELGWRMLFEAMIGYFQMHDDLHALLSNPSGPAP